jgi:hypothetical protein
MLQRMVALYCAQHAIHDLKPELEHSSATCKYSSPTISGQWHPTSLAKPKQQSTIHQQLSYTQYTESVIVRISYAAAVRAPYCTVHSTVPPGTPRWQDGDPINIVLLGRLQPVRNPTNHDAGSQP